MFKVTLINLNADATAMSAEEWTQDLGELGGDSLAVLLENFRLSAKGDAEFEPEVVVTAPAGKFLIRTGRKKLFLYNARDSAEPYVELAAPEIVQFLASAPATREIEESAFVSAEKSTHRGVAISILCAGLALNGYTLYSVFYTESVNEQPPITLLTDASEIRRVTDSFVGTFQTGEEPGDRAIILASDGTARFVEFATRNRRHEWRDTYRIGRHAGNLCFTTQDNGIVEVSGSDTLVYYRDTYRRVK